MADAPPATPRWVKVFGLIVLVLIVLVVIVHLSGGGFRGHSMPNGFLDYRLPLA